MRKEHNTMIDLYTWLHPTAEKSRHAGRNWNGLQRPCHQHKQGRATRSDFLKIAPNNKIPVIVDSDNSMTLMETGAILQYLAKKSGQLMPTDEADYWDMQQWLMFQMASVGLNVWSGSFVCPLW